MPLWVKTGPDFIREISGFRRIGNRINGCAVDIEDGILLGQYATEERAKEVFEEILWHIGHHPVYLVFTMPEK